MPGRKLLTDYEAAGRAFSDRNSFFRRRVLRETLQAFYNKPSGYYEKLAENNLQRWKLHAVEPPDRLLVKVYAGDWGEVTAMLTETYGECFTVLNMANAHVPGGAYVEGAPAQEENMFRRTNCHFSVSDMQYNEAEDRYLPEFTDLLEAGDGMVYLDTENPRICIRGAEDRTREDLGYQWLEEQEIFPFFEMRAAAVDLRYGQPFSKSETRRRIRAQLETLRDSRKRYVVLSAFGCGAFQNPAEKVAQAYAEEIPAFSGDLSVIAFAIFNPGYGPDNYPVFSRHLNTLALGSNE